MGRHISELVFAEAKRVVGECTKCKYKDNNQACYYCPVMKAQVEHDDNLDRDR